jgi:hypothetical protein
MQGLSAYFALSVVWAGLFTPFVTAAQLSTTPACCRRSGMHHCEMYPRSSRETGFQSPRSKCPYATPVLFASVNGLESGTFNLVAPSIAGFVALAPLDCPRATDSHNQGARAPPQSFL